MEILIPISVGELIDKITILIIKYLKNEDEKKQEYIIKELNFLIEIAIKSDVYNIKYLNDLFKVNSKLWRIEDELRCMENKKDFSLRFINLARSVYQLNDERALIKKKINIETNSNYREIKIY